MIESGGAADIAAKSAVPGWVLLLGALGIVIGLATYGYKVIATIGKEITELTPSRGFAAELATATTVVGASAIGLPVSTTHTLVGAVLGIGIARGIGALNLGVVGSIFMSWLITLPAGAFLAIVFSPCSSSSLPESSRRDRRPSAGRFRCGSRRRAFRASLHLRSDRITEVTGAHSFAQGAVRRAHCCALRQLHAAWLGSEQPSVIELLAAWLGELGFACETPEVAPGKFNLLASYGSGPGGWCWPDTATPCRSMVNCGRPIRCAFARPMTAGTASAAAT